MTKENKILAAWALSFILLFAARTVIYWSSEEHATFTVKRLDIVSSGIGVKHVIYTKGGEVFENSDSLTFWKFNSSDIQGELNEGEIYKARVAGWRIPFLSLYRNVISVRPK